MQSRIAGYLSLYDLLTCRLTSRKLHQAASTRCSPNSVTQVMTLIVPRLRGRSHVGRLIDCIACGRSLSVTRRTCDRCGIGLPSAIDERRVLLENLTIHRTGLATEWMLNMVNPQVQILYIDVQSFHGGKSKGCAWIHVSGAQDEDALKLLGHRLLFDKVLDPDDVEPKYALQVGVSRHSQRLQKCIKNRSRAIRADRDLPNRPLVITQRELCPPRYNGITATSAEAPHARSPPKTSLSPHPCVAIDFAAPLDQLPDFEASSESIHDSLTSCPASSAMGQSLHSSSSCQRRHKRTVLVCLESSPLGALGEAHTPSTRSLATPPRELDEFTSVDDTHFYVHKPYSFAAVDYGAIAASV